MQSHINYFDLNHLNQELANNQRASVKFALAVEGLSKGNMDVSLYDPFANYVSKKLDEKDPKVVLRAYLFAMIDLQLYLDVHPDDVVVKELFNKYLEEFRKMKEEIERKEGPLTFDSEYNLTKNWVWEQNWPFAGGKS